MTHTDEQIEAARAAYREYFRALDEDCEHPGNYLRPNDQLRAGMRAALEAAERAAWQDIATAPKDGTPILIRFRHANYKFAGDRRDEWEEVCVARWIDHNGGGWTWHGICGVPVDFRPLPQPPGEEETR